MQDRKIEPRNGPENKGTTKGNKARLARFSISLQPCKPLIDYRKHCEQAQALHLARGKCYLVVITPEQ